MRLSPHACDGWNARTPGRKEALSFVSSPRRNTLLLLCRWHGGAWPARPASRRACLRARGSLAPAAPRPSHVASPPLSGPGVLVDEQRVRLGVEDVPVAQRHTCTPTLKKTPLSGSGYSGYPPVTVPGSVSAEQPRTAVVF